VDYVFLVGVCGGVPHYTDYYNHVRLGDVIVSMPNQKGQTFIYCDKIIQDKEKGQQQFQLKSWAPQVRAAVLSVAYLNWEFEIEWMNERNDDISISVHLMNRRILI